MKKILLLNLFLFSLCALKSQDQNFLKIKKIYDDNKLEKCIKRIDAMLKKDDFKKEPALHMYQSMAWFKISETKSLNEQYPKALYKALKSANKCKEYDKSEKFLTKYRPFIERMHLRTMDVAYYEYDEEGHYNIAKKYYDEVVNLVNDTFALYMFGKCDVMNEREVEGFVSIDQAVNAVYDSYLNKSFKRNKDFIPAFYDMSTYLLESAIIDSALKTIIKGAKIFPNDDSIKTAYFEILKNYKFYCYHNRMLDKILKEAIKAANTFPNDNAFIELEKEVVYKLGEDMIIKGQYPYFENLFLMYTKRKRNGNTQIRISKSNEMLVDLLTDYHYQHAERLCRDYIKSIQKINFGLKDHLANEEGKKEFNYNFEQWIIDLVTDLNFKNEFQRSLIFCKYAKTYVPDSKAILDLEEKTNQLLNQHINSLYTLRKDLTNNKISGSKRLKKFIQLFEGYLQIFDFNEIYPALKQASQEYPDNLKIKSLYKKTLLADLKKNYDGSNLHIKKKGDNLYHELNWTGNAEKCRPGEISELAYERAEQRLNFLRRVAGSNTRVQIDRKGHKTAKKINLQEHQDFGKDCEKCEACRRFSYELKEEHVKVDLDLVKGMTKALSYFNQEEKELSGMEILLDPTAKNIIIESTNKSSIYIKSHKNDEQKPASSTPICWPPEGYVPSELVYHRWAFSLEDADFSNCIIKMKCLEKEVEIDQIIKPEYLKGTNTLIWTPLSIIKYAQMDLTYDVAIYNVKLKDQEKPQKFEYKVTIIQR